MVCDYNLLKRTCGWLRIRPDVRSYGLTNVITLSLLVSRIIKLSKVRITVEVPSRFQGLEDINSPFRGVKSKHMRT